MLVVPPTNHLASGSFHSMTFLKGLNQWNSEATWVQYASGCSMDSRYIFLYWAKDLMCAFLANSAGGGNLRPSCASWSRASLLAASTASLGRSISTATFSLVRLAALRWLISV